MSRRDRRTIARGADLDYTSQSRRADPEAGSLGSGMPRIARHSTIPTWCPGSPPAHRSTHRLPCPAAATAAAGAGSASERMST